MNAKQFVANFKTEKDMTMKLYFDGEPTEVSERIKSLGLAPNKLKDIEGVIDTVLADAYYSILLGLDGSGAIGEDQRRYNIIDEEGSVIIDSKRGGLDDHAWEAFQNNEQKPEA